MISTCNTHISAVYIHAILTTNASLKKRHFQGPYFYQNWSLPNTIIHYIAKNPSSPNAYQKIIKSCKYFFITNPIIVIEKLQLIFEADGNSNKNIIDKNLDVTSVLNKLWITSFFYNFFYDNNNAVSSIISRFYRVNVTTLHLCKQTISYEEFLFLSTKVEKLTLIRTIIKDHYSFIVPFEKIIKVLPNLNFLNFICDEAVSNISSRTMTELLKLPHFAKISTICLDNVCDAFDIETFYNYMKSNKHTKFSLHFSISVSVAYKKRLKAIINEILETKNHDYKPPQLSFFGLDAVESNALQ